MLIFVTLSSCYHESLIIEDIDTVCFDTQVLPALKTSCGIAGCHDGSAEGFLAKDYQSIIQSVVPGDPRSSKLYIVITDINGEEMMPPDQPLTQEQRSIIRVWIAQGAFKTICDTGIGGNGGNGENGGNTNVSPDSVCFVQDILPLFISNCAMFSCHDGASQGEEEFMPPSPKSPLTIAQKELMRKWIVDGALNSDCPDASCDTGNPVGFAAQVKPIIDGYCVSCHNSTATSGGVNLNGYAQVKKYAEALRNGKPLLVGTIRHMTGFKAMASVHYTG